MAYWSLDELFNCLTTAINDCLSNASFGVWTLGNNDNTNNEKVVDDTDEDIVPNDIFIMIE